MLSSLLGACSLPGPSTAPVNKDFPLVAIALFESKDEIIDTVVFALEHYWAQTRTGVWLVDGANSRKVLEGSVDSVAPRQDALWIATRDGLYMISDPEKAPTRMLKGSIRLDGTPTLGVVVSGEEAVWYARGANLQRISDGVLVDVVEMTGFLLIGTSDGIFRVGRAGEVHKILAGTALAVASQGDSALGVTDRGAVQVDSSGDRVWELEQELHRWSFEIPKFERMEEVTFLGNPRGILWSGRGYPPTWIETMGHPRDIKGAGDHFVICTTEELLVVSKSGRVVEREIGGCWLREISGEVLVSLLQAERSWVWRIGLDGAPERVAEGHLEHWAKEGSILWFSTSEGVFRAVAEGEVRRVWDRPVQNLFVTREGTWVVEERRIHLFNGADPGNHEEFLLESVVEIKEVGGVTWAVAGPDLLRLGRTGFEKVVANCYCSVIEGFPGEPVIASDHMGASFLADGGGTVQVGYGRMDGALYTAGFLWLYGEGGVWQVRPDGSAQHVGEGRLRNVFESDGTVWVSTIAGTWKVSGKSLQENRGSAERVSTVPSTAVERLHGFVWLSTGNGVLVGRAQGGELRQFGRGQVQALKDEGDSVLAITTREILRLVVADVFVGVEHQDEWASLLEVWLPGIWIEGNHKLQVEARPRTGDGHFLLDVQTFRPESFWRMSSDSGGGGSEGEAAAASGVLPFDSSGYRGIEFFLEDSVGNQLEGEEGELRGVVVDPPTAELLSIPMFLWIVAGLALLLALPRSRKAHILLVGPWGKKLWYHNILRATVHLSSWVRERLLGQYRARMMMNLARSQVLAYFIERNYPFETPNLARQMIKPDLIVLWGESGVGKTTLTHALCSRLLRAGKRYPILPLLLSVHDVEDASVTSAAVGLLARFGSLPGSSQKESLAFDLFEAGLFLIIFDNFDAVPQERRGPVLAELEVLAGNHVVMVVAQERPRELSTIRFASRQLALREFGDEEIEAVLKRRFGEVRARELVEAMTPAARDGMRNAETLTVACELFEREGRWNFGDELDVYAAVVEGLFEEWDESGRRDDRENILKLAEETWRCRKPVFDASIVSPASLSELEERRILLRRGGTHHSFRHDRLRAFFVSRVLSQNWRTSPMEDLDERWRVPLRMVVLRMSQAEDVRQLCMKVLAVNMEEGRQLFIFARSHDSRLTEDWKDSFYQRLGQKTVDTHWS